MIVLFGGAAGSGQHPRLEVVFTRGLARGKKWLSTLFAASTQRLRFGHRDSA